MTDSDQPDFYLGSEELTAWSVPRAGRVVGPVGSGVRVQLDPPAPDGSAEVEVVPRYEGTSIDPVSEWPLHVNVLTGDGTLTGVGELYRTRSEAAATTGGVGTRS